VWGLGFGSSPIAPAAVVAALASCAVVTAGGGVLGAVLAQGLGWVLDEEA